MKYPVFGIGLGFFSVSYQKYSSDMEKALDVKADPRAEMTAHNAYARIYRRDGAACLFRFDGLFRLYPLQNTAILVSFAPVLLASLTGLFLSFLP